MRTTANRLVLSNLLFLNEGEDLQSNAIDREDVYKADMIFCGDKILKNRWGKHGTIMEPYHALQQEDSYKVLLEIFNEITKKEKEI
jgi:hypothetical protein